MAVAGLLIGKHGVDNAVRDETHDHMIQFWSLIDEVLNAVLLLLTGLVVIKIPPDPRHIVVGLAVIPLLLAGRAIAVMLALAAMRQLLDLGPLAPPRRIWGGLRGGISVALALGLPDGLSRSVELTATYIVVLFAVIAQGGTIARSHDRAIDRLVAGPGRRRQRPDQQSMTPGCKAITVETGATPTVSPQACGD